MKDVPGGKRGLRGGIPVEDIESACFATPPNEVNNQVLQKLDPDELLHLRLVCLYSKPLQFARIRIDSSLRALLQPPIAIMLQANRRIYKSTDLCMDRPGYAKRRCGMNWCTVEVIPSQNWAWSM